VLYEMLSGAQPAYTYAPRALNASIDEVDDSSPYWRKEKVSFAAAYGDERVPAFVFLPKNARPLCPRPDDGGADGIAHEGTGTTSGNEDARDSLISVGAIAGHWCPSTLRPFAPPTRRRVARVVGPAHWMRT
jgi:hypothetical protein